MSYFNVFLILWVVTLLLANCINSLSRIYLTPFVKSVLVSQEDYYDNVEKIIMDIFIPLSDVCTQMTLLYLFYYQAMRSSTGLRHGRQVKTWGEGRGRRKGRRSSTGTTHGRQMQSCNDSKNTSHFKRLMNNSKG